MDSSFTPQEGRKKERRKVKRDKLVILLCHHAGGELRKRERERERERERGVNLYAYC
jgi:hypothetical protein